jgi:hypothetical protein
MHTLALLAHLQIISDDISVKVTTIAGRVKDPRRFRVATYSCGAYGQHTDMEKIVRK